MPNRPLAAVKRASLCLLALVLILCASVPGAAAVGGEDVILGGRDATGENGVIATGRADCTEIGLDILQRGGNVVAAALALFLVATVAVEVWAKRKQVPH